jgi:hypothetical protein
MALSGVKYLLMVGFVLFLTAFSALALFLLSFLSGKGRIG